MIKGHYCDNCETSLDPEAYTEYGKWSYTCPECGFVYIHGASTAEEQVERWNHGEIKEGANSAGGRGESADYHGGMKG